MGPARSWAKPSTVGSTASWSNLLPRTNSPALSRPPSTNSEASRLPQGAGGNRPLLILLAAVVTLGLILGTFPLFFNQENTTLSREIRAGASGSFIELPGGFVHYELAGSETGQPVALSHGFSVPFYVWDPTFKALVDAGFRVLRYDLFGRGYSDRPDVRYDRKLFEQQLLHLLGALEIRRPVDLVGTSMGGAIAAGFAAHHPALVRKLVLIDPFHAPLDIAPMHIPLLGEYLMDVVYAPMLPKRQMEDFYRPERFPDWPDRYREQMKYKGFRRALLSTARSFLTEDQSDVYQQVGRQNRPVLLIWGREDKTIPLSSSGRLRNVLEGKFLLVDEAGHLPHYERPDVVNPALIAFLR